MYTWGTERRINAASNYIKKTFGTRIQKLTIDAGFTCPNRDGAIAFGGCAYCNNNSFNPSYCSAKKTIAKQIEEGIEFHEKRYKTAERYFAYFQAYSNTYGTLEFLKNCYGQALHNKKIIGLIIGTRPDCVTEEILEYLAELSRKYYIVVEYGIESVYNATLEQINRGHTFEKAVEAIELSVKFGINCGAHLIFGLPGETRIEMMESAKIISSLPLHTLKFHQLQIIENTRFANEYDEQPHKFQLFLLDEYIDFITEYIARLNPKFIIERVAGETQPRNNKGISWGLRYDQVLQMVEKKLEEKDLWQGKLFNNLGKNHRPIN